MNERIEKKECVHLSLGTGERMRENQMIKLVQLSSYQVSLFHLT